MGLRVVGAGLGRTGTHSLKLALEQLLGGRCYHMMEVFGRPDDVRVWRQAADGTMPDWNEFFSDFEATVDWPAASFWQEISEANPDAIILLSTRSSPEAWWTSANETIFEITRREAPPEMAEWAAMWSAIARSRFSGDLDDSAAAIAAYERHNAEVRANAPSDRLVEWQPGDGWEPICAALDLPVPAEPFPHVNSTTDFRAMANLDAPTD